MPDAAVSSRRLSFKALLNTDHDPRSPRRDAHIESRERERERDFAASSYSFSPPLVSLVLVCNPCSRLQLVPFTHAIILLNALIEAHDDLEDLILKVIGKSACCAAFLSRA